MKRSLIALMAIALAVVFVTPPASAATGTYSFSVQPTPDFAFIGDNVSFAISGTPMSYVFVTLTSGDNSSQGIEIGEEFAQLDPRGLATVNITIPISAVAGTYYASVSLDGTEVANCTISVLFDYETWSKAKIAALEAEYQRQQNITLEYAKQVALLNDNLEQIKWFGLMTLFFAGGTMAYVWVNRKDWRNWNWSAMKRAQGLESSIKATWYLLMNPPPDGEMTFLHDGMKAKMERLRAQLLKEGKPVDNGYVVVPSPDPAQKGVVLPLNPIEIKKDVGESEIKAPKKKVVEDAIEEVEVQEPTKPGLLKRLLSRPPPRPRPQRPQRKPLFREDPMNDDHVSVKELEVEEEIEEAKEEVKPKPKVTKPKETKKSAAPRKRAPAKPKKPIEQEGGQ
ncbi:MAG: hypothetical protein SA339_08295 [Methanomassiliicoccus sp.]|nr:hypothetical protein [Methanomassiliicoccus sp.]